MDDFIVALDIGTSFIRAAIAEIYEDSLEIIGIAEAPSQGLRKGIVVNIEATIRVILAVIQEAEHMANVKVSIVSAGIAGAHIEGINSRGVVAVGNDSREISTEDVIRVLDAAQAVSLPMDRRQLHSIPREFIIDGQGGINDPLYMIGVRLEAEVHIVTASSSAMQNLIKCINGCDYGAENIFLESWAAAHASITEDERELDAMLIDIGGGTSDIIIYMNGQPYYTSVIPYGADMVTHDISIILNATLENSVRIKHEYGCCHASFVESDSEIIVHTRGGNAPSAITQSDLCEFIQPRMDEIFTMVRTRVEHDNMLESWKALGGGIVLTGGGALLGGCDVLAEEIFGVPVRIGVPLRKNITMSVQDFQIPAYATLIGILQMELDNRLFGGGSNTEYHRKRRNSSVSKQKQKIKKRHKSSFFKQFLKSFFE